MSGKPAARPLPVHSLRRRLLALVLAAVAAASLVQAAGAYRAALRQADTLFDAQLQVLAQSLEPAQAAPAQLVPGLAVRIEGAGGVLLFEAGELRLPSRPVIGFSQVVQDGARLRVYTLQTPDRTVQVAQDLDARRARARGMAWSGAWPALVSGVLLMVAIWWVVDRTLAPVEKVRRQVAGRAAEDLSPLPEDSLPQEVLPLVRELNLLLGRVREGIAARQAFIGHAAHELRSPLAALRLQVQGLRRRADPSLPPAPLESLEAGIDRAAALVAQLLALAREEALPAAGDGRVAPEAICRSVMADLLPLAHARRIDLGLLPSPGLQVRGDAPSLEALLRNLVDNALKYTPEGGRVDISWRARQEMAVVLVEDSGPGLEPDDQRRLLAPFARGPAAEQVPGSGLGLAIVSAILRRHAGSLALGRSERLGGLAAEVSLPLA